MPVVPGRRGEDHPSISGQQDERAEPEDGTWSPRAPGTLPGGSVYHTSGAPQLSLIASGCCT